MAIHILEIMVDIFRPVNIPNIRNIALIDIRPLRYEMWSVCDRTRQCMLFLEYHSVRFTQIQRDRDLSSIAGMCTHTPTCRPMTS